MSYSIIRIEKVKGSFITGLQIHNQREKELTNKDIDKEKTSQNYDLKNGTNTVNYEERFKQIIADAGVKTVRKTSVKAVDVLTTSDTEFFDKLSDEEQAKYFQANYDFLAEKYGERNIIASVVHLDEKTPHMHTTIVPITEDGRLSARDFFNPPIKLKQLQTEYNYYINEKGFELQRGVTSDRKHIELEKFKVETAKKELEKELAQKKQSVTDIKNNLDKKIISYEEEQKAHKNELLQENESLRTQNRQLLDRFGVLNKQVTAKKELIDSLKQIDSNILIKSKELNSIENKGLQAKSELEKTAEKIEKLNNEYNKEKDIKYQKLEQEIELKKQAIPNINIVPTSKDGVIATYQLEKAAFSKDYKISNENIEKLAKTLADNKTAVDNSKKFENFAKSELASERQEYKKEVSEKNREIYQYKSLAEKTKRELSRYKETVSEFMAENKLYKAFEQFPAKQLAKQIEKEFEEASKITKEYKEHKKDEHTWDNCDSYNWDKYRELQEKRAEQYDKLNALIEKSNKQKHFEEVSKNYNNLDARIEKHNKIQSQSKEIDRGYSRGGIGE